MTTIRPATEADRPKLVDSLASAFAEDPLFNWMAGTGPDKPLEPKVRILFDAFAKLEFAPTCGTCRSVGAPVPTTISPVVTKPCRAFAPTV